MRETAKEWLSCRVESSTLLLNFYFLLINAFFAVQSFNYIPKFITRGHNGFSHFSVQTIEKHLECNLKYFLNANESERYAKNKKTLWWPLTTVNGWPTKRRLTVISTIDLSWKLQEMNQPRLWFSPSFYWQSMISLRRTAFRDSSETELNWNVFIAIFILFRDMKLRGVACFSVTNSDYYSD